MQVLQETTKWSDSTSNHVYFMDNSREKMYAYVVRGSMDVFKFKRPIRINTRGRTFVAVPNIWNFDIPQQQETKTDTVEVVGSSGQKYIVKKSDGICTCTCPGFKYRGECKHVKKVTNGS